jgi:hypothetical protein
LALVDKTRIAGDHEKPADAGECGDDLLGQSSIKWWKLEDFGEQPRALPRMRP